MRVDPKTYGLPPRLWLLILTDIVSLFHMFQSKVSTSAHPSVSSLLILSYRLVLVLKQMSKPTQQTQNW